MYASAVRRSTTFTLANGAQIPKLGFGTWKMSKEEAAPAVAHALKAGFRHLDCAWAYRNEDAFRQEVWLAAVLLPLALWLPVGAIGKALMIASVLLVIVVELVNSALEATVDRISLDHHHLAKRAKDIGSAAVFVALLNVLVVWGLILFA